MFGFVIVMIIEDKEENVENKIVLLMLYFNWFFRFKEIEEYCMVYLRELRVLV